MDYNDKIYNVDDMQIYFCVPISNVDAAVDRLVTNCKCLSIPECLHI